jgi:SOS response regulatory protein OraA/RecX
VTPGTALEQAAAALARRDHSAAGLTAYLAERGVDPDEAAEAVERLRQAGYLDDARVATLRAETLAARGYGDAAIRADLARRGLAEDEIAAGLDALTPETERARELIAELGASERIARRLAAKGFGTDSIESALASAFPGG